MSDRDDLNDSYRCPACGGRLFIGEGGWITCSWVKCPSPDFAIALAADVVREEEPSAAAVGVQEPDPPACAWVNPASCTAVWCTVHRHWNFEPVPAGWRQGEQGEQP